MVVGETLNLPGRHLISGDGGQFIFGECFTLQFHGAAPCRAELLRARSRALILKGEYLKASILSHWTSDIAILISGKVRPTSAESW